MKGYIIVEIPDDWNEGRIEAFIDGILRECKVRSFFIPLSELSAWIKGEKLEEV